MVRTRRFHLGFLVLIVALALVGGLWAMSDYYAGLPQRAGAHETLVLGQNRFTPGSQAALRVIVRNRRDAAPRVGAGGRVQLPGRAADGAPDDGASRLV